MLFGKLHDLWFSTLKGMNSFLCNLIMTQSCLDSKSLNFSLFSFVLHLFSVDEVDFNFFYSFTVGYNFCHGNLCLLEFSQEGWLNLNFFLK